MQEKDTMISRITAELTEPGAALPQPFVATDKEQYRKYELDGTFLYSKSMFLYSSKNSHPEKHGYFIMTPFLTNDGKYVLVNSGWIPASLRDLLTQEIQKPQSNQVHITAMLVLPQKPSVFLPSNDPEKNMWLYIDLKEMDEFVGRHLESSFYMILQSTSAPINNVFITDPKDFLTIRNDHLSYALTWFIFAVILGVSQGVVGVRKLIEGE